MYEFNMQCQFKTKKRHIMLKSMCAGAMMGALISLNMDVLASITLIHIPLIIVLFLFSILWSVVIHELGHLVCGRLTGYTFLSFRLLSWLIKYDDTNKLRIYRYSLTGSLGQCLMLPPKTKPLPIFWYNFGGVFFNIITGIFAGGLLLFVNSLWMYLLCLCTLFWNVLMAIMNWSVSDDQSNDGTNYYVMKTNPKSRDAFHELLTIHGKLSNGIKLTDINLDDLQNLDLQGDDAIQMNALQFLHAKDMFTGQFDKAAHSIGALIEKKQRTKGLMLNMLRTDYYLVKLLQQDPNAINHKTKEVSQVLKQMKHNDGVAMILLIEASIKHSHLDQEQYDIFRKCCESSVLPGYALDCVHFVDEIWIPSFSETKANLDVIAEN